MQTRFSPAAQASDPAVTERTMSESTAFFVCDTSELDRATRHLQEQHPEWSQEQAVDSAVAHLFLLQLLRIEGLSVEQLNEEQRLVFKHASELMGLAYAEEGKVCLRRPFKPIGRYH
jgi:hypothetical protein